MKLEFIKIDKVIQHVNFKSFKIPVGGIQFSRNNETIAINEALDIVMMNKGGYQNLLRDVDFVIYTDQSLQHENKVLRLDLFSIVAHEEVSKAIDEYFKKNILEESQ